MTKAHIKITRGAGETVEFTVPVVQITTKGVVVKSGKDNSPATEWFAFQSKHVTSELVKS